MTCKQQTKGKGEEMKGKQKGDGVFVFFIMLSIVGLFATAFDLTHTKGVKDHYSGKFTCETIADGSVECYLTKSMKGA